VAKTAPPPHSKPQQAHARSGSWLGHATTEMIEKDDLQAALDILVAYLSAY
jgi:hypothetical protein